MSKTDYAGYRFFVFVLWIPVKVIAAPGSRDVGIPHLWSDQTFVYTIAQQNTCISLTSKRIDRSDGFERFLRCLRQEDSRLFLVREKFIRISLKSSRIFGTFYMYQYAISEELRNREACRYKDWEHMLYCEGGAGMVDEKITIQDASEVDPNLLRMLDRGLGAPW